MTEIQSMIECLEEKRDRLNTKLSLIEESIQILEQEGRSAETDINRLTVAIEHLGDVSIDVE